MGPGGNLLFKVEGSWRHLAFKLEDLMATWPLEGAPWLFDTEGDDDPETLEPEDLGPWRGGRGRDIWKLARGTAFRALDVWPEACRYIKFDFIHQVSYMIFVWAAGVNHPRSGILFVQICGKQS